MSINFQQYDHYSQVLSVKGKILEVPLRKGREDAAFIDYLTFSIGKSTLHSMMQDDEVFLGANDETYIEYYSQKLQQIFGFGITVKRKGKGKFFYQHYYQLGPEDVNYGTVHIGGQRETILVDLNAIGCQAALSAWENRLYYFLTNADRPKITRCDVAHDFLNGEYTPEQGLTDREHGKFDVKNMRPKAETRGTSWIQEDGTGKTLYIGRRGSSKLTRIYEKGKQLGDENSLWVRYETEFRANDAIVPPDILVKPGQYLTGAYPIGETLFKNEVKRIEAATKKVQLNFNEKLAHAKNQVGRIVRFLHDLGWTAEQIRDALISEENKYPKGLNPMEYDCTTQDVTYIHDELFESIITPLDEIIQLYEVVHKVCEIHEDINLRLPEHNELLEHFNRDFKDWQELYWQLSKAPVYADAKKIEQRQFDFLFIKYGALIWDGSLKTVRSIINPLNQLKPKEKSPC